MREAKKGKKDNNVQLGMFLGYAHPSGEVHITDSGPWESCPGTVNSSNRRWRPNFLLQVKTTQAHYVSLEMFLISLTGTLPTTTALITVSPWGVKVWWTC